MTHATRSFLMGSRKIGGDSPPLVIAEIGINHNGDIGRAIAMIDNAASAGCECVKFQCHVIDDEYVPAAANVIPSNSSESILEIMNRCALTEAEDAQLKLYAESKGMLYLSSPFSRAAADRLQALGVVGFKIGSGECNNTPLIRHIARMGKPLIVSTGMNDLASIAETVAILDEHRVEYCLLHCTSLYPTPYPQVRLGALAELGKAFPQVPLGLSCHSLGIQTCIAAVALGAKVLEKHFTSNKAWPGPDISLSITPPELELLVHSCRTVHEALGGTKSILPQEQPTIDFAYASVVSTVPIEAGTPFSSKNLWVKRPGTGEIHAREYESLLGRRAAANIEPNTLLLRSDVGA